MSGAGADVQLIAATPADLPVAEHLSSYYIYDMSEYMGWPCSASGQYGGCDEFFADWRAGRNYVFIIRVDNELGGFTGVCHDEGAGGYAIQEFFVLRKFRRAGVGRKVACALFDRLPGSWMVQYLVENKPAAGFWPKVIGAYTGGRFTDAGVVSSPWGDLATLRFRSGPA